MHIRPFIVCLFVAMLVLPGTGHTQDSLSMKPNPVPLGRQVPAQQSRVDQDVPQYKRTLYERLHEMFSKSTEGGDPTKTLQAPFIKPSEQLTPTADAMGLPYDPTGGVNPNAVLAEPHRDEDQVGNWLSDRVSEILDTSGVGWQDHLKDVSPLMTTAAAEAYAKFMNDNNLVGMMVANNMKTHAFVEMKPLLLNKGVVDGRFRWLYEVQATMTFMPLATKSYEEVLVKNSNNFRVVVRIQIGRVADRDSAQGGDASGAEQPGQHIANDDDTGAGLILESWDAQKNMRR